MIPMWMAVMIGLASFLCGVGVGVIIAWEEEYRHEIRRIARRDSRFTDPGMSRERLGLKDGMREQRAGKPRLRPVADDAIEGPQEFGGGA